MGYPCAYAYCVLQKVGLDRTHWKYFDYIYSILFYN
jgi:hypothetical protein